MAFDYSKLQAALVVAIEAAKLAAPGDDGGSCNFDAPEVCIPRGRLAKVEALAKAVGLSTFKSDNGYFVFTVPFGGQGFVRTRQAEAMAKVLKEHGFTTSVYYAMD